MKELKEFINDRKQRNKSFKNHKSCIGNFMKYLESYSLEIDQVNIAEAQRYQEYLLTAVKEDGSLKNTAVTVLTAIGRITTFYEYLLKKGKVLNNPFQEIERIKRPRSLSKNILTEDQIKKLLDYLRNFSSERNLTERRRLYRAHILCELLFSTGARINEIAKLKLSDVDTIRGVVKVKDSKTKKTREVFLNNYTEKVLTLYIQKMRIPMVSKKKPEGTDLLFGATPAVLGIWLNTILKELSVKLKFPLLTSHSFRHTFGSLFLKNGCDIRFIQEMLGHTELRTTQIYTRVSKEDLKNVIDLYHPRKVS